MSSVHPFPYYEAISSQLASLKSRSASSMTYNISPPPCDMICLRGQNNSTVSMWIGVWYCNDNAIVQLVQDNGTFTQLLLIHKNALAPWERSKPNAYADGNPRWDGFEWKALGGSDDFSLEWPVFGVSYIWHTATHKDMTAEIKHDVICYHGSIKSSIIYPLPLNPPETAHKLFFMSSFICKGKDMSNFSMDSCSLILILRRK